MKNKQEAIEMLKELMNESICKRIGLKVSSGTAQWKCNNPTTEQWKKIGYVSALCWVFSFTDKDFN